MDSWDKRSSFACFSSEQNSTIEIADVATLAEL